MKAKEIPTAKQKQDLKLMKTVPESVKVAVYEGCKNPGASSQFHTDVQMYGLFEALLYVESYETKYYAKGTAEKAMLAACRVVHEQFMPGAVGWPGDGSGEDDLADMNQNEADDYRDE